MWHFWNGYVIIQIEGLSAARFLRRLIGSGIRVSDVRRIDARHVLCRIPAKRFFALHRLSRGLRIRVHIVKRGGLLFLAGKLYRRPVLWAGSCVLLIALFIVSRRIWIIRIDETKRIDRDEIVKLLDEHGIRRGAALHGPILITAAEDLCAQIKDAAWIGLDREGVVLTVSVKESTPASPKKTDRIPSDVIAQKDGVVLSVQVMRGQAQVCVGDRVKAGDVLISGTILYHDQAVETSADGVVVAAVEYEAETELPETVSETVETGRTETVRVLRFSSIELLRMRPSFEHYRITDEKTVSVSPMLPVYVDTRTAREIIFSERSLTPEEAEQLAIVQAKESAFALIPREAAIINTYAVIRVRGGKRYAAAIVTAEETIGKTEENPHDG